jgi:glycosyltransferase involved in cell wall biosynthesis
MNTKTVSIVTPCFNEQNNLSPLVDEIINTNLPSEFSLYEIILVDDGSSDNSQSMIKSLSQKYPTVKGILFSKNFGNQNAIKAGLDAAGGDFIVSMDADLQQPPSVIVEMLELTKQNYQIVLTERVDDEEINLRVMCAKVFYIVLNSITKNPIPYGSSDFRLISKKVLNAIRQHREYETFFRGIIPEVGFKQCTIKYRARKRFSGKSKLSIKKLLNLAISGITSSSVIPLRVSMMFGLLTSLVAFCYLIYILYAKLIIGEVISGWASTIVSILFLGGVQLICLGVIGEYIGKIFYEVKNRPPYIVDEKIGF